MRISKPPTGLFKRLVDTLRNQTLKPAGVIACAVLLSGMSPAGRTQTMAPNGCPTFHCTVDATGVMNGRTIQQASVALGNGEIGSQVAQGCSGNGTALTCLFVDDKTTGSGSGTLKLIDATSLQPIWGSSGIPNSYNLDPHTAAIGQVPVNFANGNIAAGDAYVHTLYSPSGSVLGSVALDGVGKNFGMTPISSTWGIVSQSDGVLTLVNLSTWQSAGSLTLLDPSTNERVALVSPSSGANGVLYAVANNASNGNGILFAVGPNPGGPGLVVRASFSYLGVTGASAVVIGPGVSGLSANLVLLGVPGLIGDTQAQARMLGLLDMGSGFVPFWTTNLANLFLVSPSIDQVSQTLFLSDQGSPTLTQYSFLTGATLNSFNVQQIGGFPSNFALNGHLGSSQSGPLFTLLLAGAVPSGNGTGQYVMAFNPDLSPTALMWSKKVDSHPSSYTAAWNFGPAGQWPFSCPIVVGVINQASSLYRVCDR